MLPASLSSPPRATPSTCAGIIELMYTAHGQLSLATSIRQHAPLVRRIAQHMMARLPPSVELDDLIQVGMIGPGRCLVALRNQPWVQFETFASQRIRGAMLDELRGSDWMSRSARKGQKTLKAPSTAWSKA